VTGYGVVAVSAGGTAHLLAAGTVKNTSRQPIPERLHRIYTELLAIMRRFPPSEFAIESSFYGKNAQSALKLGQARGVALLAAVGNAVPCFEYTPREVKQSVVGNGAAGKQQVQYMVRSTLQLDDRPLPLDTSDAIAVALCHLYRTKVRRPSPTAGTWKAYVTAHPERVVR
jgi:crossover junction endodeoxyribonuclease RuvC